jgi:hypothetical protein
MKRLLPLALAIAATVITQPIINAHEIVIIENSPTSLTATFDGSSIISITQNIPDQWVITFPAAHFVNITNSGFGVNWVEPENFGLVNNVISNLQRLSDLFITSDTTAPGGPVLVNGTTFDNVGFGSDFQPINLTFFDNAATAEGAVPDTGSTVGLLFLSLAGLLGATRVRSLTLV